MTAPYDALPEPRALGLSTVNGLPAHILIVHAVVVLVPLAAISLVAALRPSVARRFGVWLPILSAAAFISVLAAMNAGDWLQQHVRDDALVHRHTEMAGQLWPFSAVVVLLSIALWWTSGRAATEAGDASDAEHRQRASVAGGTAVSVAVGVLAVAVAVGSVVQVVRIGDSGSRAAWHDKFSHDQVSDGDGAS
jgi:hypothetical protein